MRKRRTRETKPEVLACCDLCKVVGGFIDPSDGGTGSTVTRP